MITDPWFYAAAIPAILIVGLSKGGFAGGLGILGVPLMSLAVPPLQAAGIMLPILCAMDIIGIWAYRHSFHRRNLMILLPGAVAGIVIAALTARYLSEGVILLLVGGIAVIFALDHWIGRRAAQDPKPPHAVKGSLWGGIGGFTSFIAHAGGPPFQVYMLPQKLDKKLYVGTSVFFFWLVNLIKLPPYAYLGELSLGNLETSAVLLPLAPIGMLMGIRALHLIPEKPFYRLAYILVFLVGLKLLWDGASRLLA